ncbi:hypothetical protein ACFOPX_05280 [Helicobacter baculiformis]|uniref:DUF1311 domain-containing protein n=1 Tax=Helicobacter baculiformis TaxID=427351 RepID=A0ABV7ZIC4_9HELI|nr:MULTISPECIES: hypothetical protein [Helicobacter]
MKRILGLLCLLGGVVLAQGRLEIVCAKSYQEKQCGDDFSCGASKCWIKNTNLLGALKNDLNYWLEKTSRDPNGGDARCIQFFKRVLASKSLLQNQKFGPQEENFYGLEIKRLDAKTISVHTDLCMGGDADFAYTYHQKGKDVERIEMSDKGE